MLIPWKVFLPFFCWQTRVKLHLFFYGVVGPNGPNGPSCGEMIQFDEKNANFHSWVEEKIHINHLKTRPRLLEGREVSPHFMENSRLITPPKFKSFAPEKWWLEDYFPIGKLNFQGLC